MPANAYSHFTKFLSRNRRFVDRSRRSYQKRTGLMAPQVKEPTAYFVNVCSCLAGEGQKCIDFFEVHHQPVIAVDEPRRNSRPREWASTKGTGRSSDSSTRAAGLLVLAESPGQWHEPAHQRSRATCHHRVTAAGPYRNRTGFPEPRIRRYRARIGVTSYPCGQFDSERSGGIGQARLPRESNHRITYAGRTGSVGQGPEQSLSSDDQPYGFSPHISRVTGKKAIARRSIRLVDYGLRHPYHPPNGAFACDTS